MITFQGIALLLCNSREVVHEAANSTSSRANLIAGAKDPVTGLNLLIPPYVLAFFADRAARSGCLLKLHQVRPAHLRGRQQPQRRLPGRHRRQEHASGGVRASRACWSASAATMLLARINVGIITLGQNLEIDTIAMVVIGGTALKGGKGQHRRHADRRVVPGLDRQRHEHAAAAFRGAVRGQGPSIVVIAVSAGDVSSAVSEFRASGAGRSRPAIEAAAANKGGDSLRQHRGEYAELIAWKCQMSNIKSWRTSNEATSRLASQSGRARHVALRAPCRAADAKVIGYYMDDVGRLLQGRLRSVQGRWPDARAGRFATSSARAPRPSRSPPCENFITQKVDALLVVQNSPADHARECLKLADAAGIPVFHLHPQSAERAGPRAASPATTG